MNRYSFFPQLLALPLLLAACAPVGAEDIGVQSSERHDFRVVTVAEDLDHPWGLAFLPNGDMLVTERRGRLRLIKDGELQATAIGGTPDVVARGQGGLLDVALHPDFAENQLVYLSYAGAGDGGAGTEVVRGRLVNTRLHDLEVIFRAAPKTGGRNHYGSRLVFAPDGTLYITVGDRVRYQDQAQDPGDHLGTVVRVNDDGSVPADNPLIDQAGARPEVFTYGHRNAQGLAWRPGAEQLWLSEHGPRGGDEVNLLKPGANYGWPEITYGINYNGTPVSDRTSAPGMEQPVVYWDPSIAPSGLAFYEGEAFPNWQDNLFVGALAHQHLRRLELVEDQVVAQEALLEDLDERIRDVRVGPDGLIYVLTDSSDGRLLRLEPVGG
ncbi:MAG: PQQ-dependent sugar dehydrogenase [Pseudomonadota bacterium]